MFGLWSWGLGRQVQVLGICVAWDETQWGGALALPLSITHVQWGGTATLHHACTGVTAFASSPSVFALGKFLPRSFYTLALATGQRGSSVGVGSWVLSLGQLRQGPSTRSAVRCAFIVCVGG